MQVAVIQGRVYRDGEGTIPVWSRGLVYGDGVFSTVRLHGGRPVALAEHLARLERMAHAARIRRFDAGALEQEIALGLGAAEGLGGVMRLLVVRGGRLGGALDRDEEALRVVLIEPWSPPPARVYREGVAVRLVAGWAGVDLKSTSYQPALLRLEEAREQGFDEVLGLGARGELLEGATSNVFLVQGMRLLTPPLDGRILAGVTRGRVLAIGHEMGLDVREIRLDHAALRAADEVFLTSSLRELVPVRRVVAGGMREAPGDGGTRGGESGDAATRSGEPGDEWSGAPGSITRRLHEAYGRLFGGPGRPWEGER
jgi:branched-chain amino acid aminotransferase